MSMLKHSYPGFRRLMQISSDSFFVFVEGFIDHHVFAAIIDAKCRNGAVNYDVRMAETLPGGSGGKSALLEFFNYLRRRSSLVDKFQGKTTVAFFYLDKDIDDLRRVKRRSKHIQYTETYELENYLFLHGDISKAAAAASCMNIRTVRRQLGSYALWQLQAATAWKEWVKLCIFAHCKSCGERYYSRPKSQINENFFGDVSQLMYREHLKNLQSKSGLAKDKFNASFQRCSRSVEKLYLQGQYNRVFKGQWYAWFLIEDIKRVAGTSRYKTDGLYDNLITHLTTTIDFGGSWADYFWKPLHVLLSDNSII